MISGTRAEQTPVPLLEREAALGLLRGALAEALAGEGRCVLVHGEAGIGKTALLQFFCNWASGDARVLRGACDPLFTPRPLGPFADIARAIGEDLRELVETGSVPQRVAAALVDELGERAPSIVVIEDMHWADEASLDVFRLLAGRIAALPALLVATYRDDELADNHPVRLVVGELPSRSTSRIALERLSSAAVDELARQAERPAHGLYATTGGNPFFVTEVLAVHEEGIPATVRDAVLARAGRLVPGARRLLEAVAIAPGPAELWLLERLAPDELPYLDECLASGVLRSSRDHVAFRHELARLVIEESLAPQRRVSLNRDALAALAAPPSGVLDLSRLAHHADAGADGDGVLRFAPAAGELAAAVGAHREAAAQYERALRFADGLQLETQAHLCERLSYESYLTGDFGDAIAASTRALESYRQLEDVRSEGECLVALSRLLWSIGRTPDGSTVGRQAVELLESVSAGRELALGYAQLAEVSMILDDYDEVLRMGSAAAELAQQLGERDVSADARMLLNAARYAVGQEGGRESLERELSLALSEGLEAVAARAYNHLARLGLQRRDYEFVDRHLDRGFEYCRDRELGNFRQGMVAEQSRRLLDRGDWERATDAAHLVLSTARTAGMAPFVALIVLGQVRARRGDPDVWAPLDRAMEMADGTGELRRLGPLAAARAEAAWLANDRERTLDEARVAFGLAVEKRHSWFAGELAYWMWKGGGPDAAPELAAEPYRLQMTGSPREAAAIWIALGCPYEAAWALAESGDEEALHDALAKFERLGALPATRSTRHTLRSLGATVPRGPRSSTRANVAQLTTRELDVLGLVATGLRNGEIAERLVLSRRTVDHHVSAILRKLDARTRGEAVAEAARLGVLEDGQALQST